MFSFNLFVLIISIIILAMVYNSSLHHIHTDVIMIYLQNLQTAEVDNRSVQTSANIRAHTWQKLAQKVRFPSACTLQYMYFGIV